MLGRQLGAVGPVDLIAVILLGIVAGGDIDARLTVVFPHGEAQLRRGPQRLEDTHMDAVGGADLCGGSGKLHRVVAAVHAQGHAPALGLLALSADDVGKALSGPADDVDVHLVQADAHGAAQAGGAELQRGKEPALNLLLVAGNRAQLLLFRLAERRTAEPLFINITIGHGTNLQYLKFWRKRCTAL